MGGGRLKCRHSCLEGQVKYLLLTLALCPLVTFAQQVTSAAVPQPYPFAASRDYPKIPGICIVPAWEYPLADVDGNGVMEVAELKRYCRLADRQRQAMRIRPGSIR